MRSAYANDINVITRYRLYRPAMETQRSRRNRRRVKVEDRPAFRDAASRPSDKGTLRLQCPKCSKRLGLVWLTARGEWDGTDFIGTGHVRGPAIEPMAHLGRWLQFQCPGHHKQRCGYTWQGRDPKLVALIRHAEATGSGVVVLRDVAPAVTAGGTQRF